MRLQLFSSLKLQWLEERSRGWYPCWVVLGGLCFGWGLPSGYLAAGQGLYPLVLLVHLGWRAGLCFLWRGFLWCVAKVGGDRGLVRGLLLIWINCRILTVYAVRRWQVCCPSRGCIWIGWRYCGQQPLVIARILMVYLGMRNTSWMIVCGWVRHGLTLPALMLGLWSLCLCLCVLCLVYKVWLLFWYRYVVCVCVVLVWSMRDIQMIYYVHGCVFCCC